MREAIGATWIMGIVVFFIVLFSAFLALSVNYSRAFNVKNTIVDIIEKHGGHDICACCEILDYLHTVGFHVAGNCRIRYREAEPGADSSETRGFALLSDGPRYCIAEHQWVRQDPGGQDLLGGMRQSHFTVSVFFQVDIPIFRDLFMFPVFGETKTITMPNASVTQACRIEDCCASQPTQTCNWNRQLDICRRS